MRVCKRDGEFEPVSFDKVLNRLSAITEGLGLVHVNIYEIAQKVCSRIYDGVKTSELDELAAQMCSSLTLEHPEYGKLAAGIIISNHQKKTSPSFSETINQLYQNTSYDEHNPLVSDEVYQCVQKNRDKLNSVIDYKRDYLYDYFGFKTLEKSYLLRVNDKIVERPQHLWMRVAIGIHGFDLKDVLETYEYLSTKYFVHATPTLFNAGTNHPQCSSCFLTVLNDSIDGIFDGLKECARISKFAGGIGIEASEIRPKNSRIKGTNGVSAGIIPMIKVFHYTAKYVDQSGRRNGSFAIYLEPWHADIYEFLDLKKNHGIEEERARDLFYGLWIPDLFMQRVEKNEKWSLMCPNVSKGLVHSYGEEFNKLYLDYESKGMYIKQVDAQELWFKILASQIETGTPYMLYKDHVNRKNNQMNIGVIKSSNLCTEIVEYTDDKETAVCNLASICLPQFLSDNQFDFQKFQKIVKIIVKNLNKIIDKNFYPSEKARYSNLKNRPLGIGVQGLADLFVLLNLPFESEKAKELNKQVFETLYFSALEASMELAKKHGITYESYQGSPTSKGILQFDLWNKKVSNERHDWDLLKSQIKEHGLLNSLLIAPMPTASTSQIMGFNEAFEPFTSNIYKRKTMAGEFILVNKYLIDDLQKLGLWNVNIKNNIILNEGSVQNIPNIPQNIKDLYKTAYEIKQKSILDMAADRGQFIDQSQSMNIFVDNPNFTKLTSIHFHAWKQGLKTGMYYLRTKAKAKPQQFTMDQNLSKFTNLKPREQQNKDNNESEQPDKKTVECTDEVCVMCSS